MASYVKTIRSKSRNRPSRLSFEQLERRQLLAADLEPIAEFVVTNTLDDGPGSLRQAISNANASTTASEIRFEIPEADAGYVDVDASVVGGDPLPDVFRISPQSALPAIENIHAQRVQIDGRTQSAFTGQTNPFGPEIEIDGELAGDSAGLQVKSSSLVEIRNLIVGGFQRAGIEVDGERTLLKGNYIGTNATGTGPNANEHGIVGYLGLESQFGGPNTGEGNLVSGNRGYGIEIHANFHSGQISGNWIGTNATGDASIANSNGGIVTLPGSHSITIGGPTAQHGNLISGNQGFGVFVWESYQTTVQNNVVGTDRDGGLAIPNAFNGIRLQEGRKVVVSDNLLSGNAGHGIDVAGVTGTTRMLQWRTDRGGNDHFYVEVPRMNWFDAEALAVRFGGHLVDIENAAENEFIATNFGESWIGLSDYQNEDSFTWTSGHIYDASQFTAFSAPEPNGGTRENSVVINDDGTWNDLSSNSSVIAIIEFSTVPQILDIVDAVSGVVIDRNIVGLGRDGMTAIGNGKNGISVEGAGLLASDFANLPSGTFPGPGISILNNVTSGNSDHGIRLWRSTGIISGNRIGTSSDGVSRVGNRVAGIEIESSESLTIGGWNSSESNTISGNGAEGVIIYDSMKIDVIGNRIGTDITGTRSIANQSSGIWITDSTEIRIGIEGLGAANTIANNLEDGITIEGDITSSVSVSENMIYGNADLGIDLGDDGPTVNDLGDGDTGPNGLQNYPLLQTVVGTLTGSMIAGMVSLSPQTIYQVDIFSDDVIVASQAQGRTYLGSAGGLTDATGQGIFSILLPYTIAAGTWITTTATDVIAQTTSEFSPAIAMGLVDSLRPTSRVNPLPRRASGKSFDISITGIDLSSPVSSTSGVKEYDLYVAERGQPFEWYTTVPASNPVTTFSGASNTTYFFRSIARDHAGNVETKRMRTEAIAYVGDFDPPSTFVSNVDSTTATFTIDMAGAELGGGRITILDLYVSIDSQSPTKVVTLAGGRPDASGIYRWETKYPAIRDGASHTYRFYTIGVDSNGNTESTPSLLDDIIVTASFLAPVALSATGIDVERGAKQRSYIRNVDLLFNTTNGLQAIMESLADSNTTNDRLQLQRFSTDGTGSGVNVALGSSNVTLVGSSLAFNFGQNGIGGARNSTVGNGYYVISIDNDGDGIFDQSLRFYRLLGDANGDRRVNTSDLQFVAEAMRQPALFPDADLNGDGRIDAIDRAMTSLGRGTMVGLTLPLDD